MPRNDKQLEDVPIAPTEAPPTEDAPPTPGQPQEVPDVWVIPAWTWVPPITPLGALLLALLTGCGGTQAARADARRTACAAVQSACAVAHAACSR